MASVSPKTPTKGHNPLSEAFGKPGIVSKATVLGAAAALAFFLPSGASYNFYSSGNIASREALAAAVQDVRRGTHGDSASANFLEQLAPREDVNPGRLGGIASAAVTAYREDKGVKCTSVPGSQVAATSVASATVPCREENAIQTMSNLVLQNRSPSLKHPLRDILMFWNLINPARTIVHDFLNNNLKNKLFRETPPSQAAGVVKGYWWPFYDLRSVLESKIVHDAIIFLAALYLIFGRKKKAEAKTTVAQASDI